MSNNGVARFLVAWVLAFAVWFGGAYEINARLVDFAQVAQLWRPWEEELRLFPVLYLSDGLTTGAFVWLYLRCLKPEPWLGQGVRFGLMVFPLTIIPMYLRSFVAQPVPVTMLIQQLVYFGILVTLIGVIVAFVYRNVTQQPRESLRVDTGEGRPPG